MNPLDQSTLLPTSPHKHLLSSSNALYLVEPPWKTAPRLNNSKRTFTSSSSGDSLASVGENGDVSTLLPVSPPKSRHLLRKEELIKHETFAMFDGPPHSQDVTMDLQGMMAKISKPKRASGTEESFVDLLHEDIPMLDPDETFLPSSLRPESKRVAKARPTPNPNPVFRPGPPVPTRTPSKALPSSPSRSSRRRSKSLTEATPKPTTKSAQPRSIGPRTTHSTGQTATASHREIQLPKHTVPATRMTSEVKSFSTRPITVKLHARSTSTDVKNLHRTHTEAKSNNSIPIPRSQSAATLSTRPTSMRPPLTISMSKKLPTALPQPGNSASARSARREFGADAARTTNRMSRPVSTVSRSSTLTRTSVEPTSAPSTHRAMSTPASAAGRPTVQKPKASMPPPTGLPRPTSRIPGPSKMSTSIADLRARLDKLQANQRK